MHKTVICLTILTAVCFGVTIFSEDFSSSWTPNSPPTGWHIYHSNAAVEGTDDWHREDSADGPWVDTLGGRHPSAYASIYWNLSADAPPDSLISPIIDCSGYKNVTLRCSTFFSRKLPVSYQAQLRYSVDNGATFPYLLRDYYERQVYPAEETFNLSHARNQTGVVLAWFFDGDLYNVYWWCLDDVIIEGDSILPWDIACTRIADPAYTIKPGLMTPQARFTNYGLNDQDSIPVFCVLYESLGGAAITAWQDTIFNTLHAGGYEYVSFVPAHDFLTTGDDFYIQFWCEADSDYARSNDTLDRVFDVSYVEEYRYDNGSVSTRENWPVGHYGWGARFTPTAPLPVFLHSVRMYLQFPAGPAEHCRYQIAVVKEASDGSPGETYFKTPVITGAPGTTGWNTVDLAPNPGDELVFDDNFFIFYLQVGEPPECASIGLDGSRNAPDSTYWQYRAGIYQLDSAGGDFMIRVTVDHPPPTLIPDDMRALYVDTPWYEFVQRPFDAPLTPAARFDNNGGVDIPDVVVSCSIFGQGNVLPHYVDEQRIGTFAAGADTLMTFTDWVPDTAEQCSVVTHIYSTNAVVIDPQSGNNEKWFVFEAVKGIHTGGSGVPGEYGWIDSDTTDGPTFQWIDTTGAVVVLTSPPLEKIYVPIGFNFPYCDSVYSNVIVCTNGWLSFGTDQQTTESLPRILPDVNIPNGALYPWWDNLTAGQNEGGGKVYRKIEGTAPNRRCAVIWQDVNRDGCSDTSDLVSFEVVLYESGTIVFQYKDVTTGDLTYDNARYAAIGLENEDGSDGLCYLYARPPMSSAVNDLANRVSPGRAIRFQKVYRDAAVLDIVSPAAYVFEGPLTPQATIHNYGSIRDTIRAFFFISPGYLDSLTIPDLAPGDSTTASFAVWNATLGEYTAKCSVAMVGDVADSNNVVSKVFYVSPWIQQEDIPLGPRRRKVKGAALTYVPPPHNRLYALKGANTLTLWVFDIATGQWDSLSPMPRPPSEKRAKAGCELAYDPDHGAEGTIWALKGGGRTDFYAYDIATDVWTAKKSVFLPRVPGYRPPKRGAALAYVAGSGGPTSSIYCIPGNNTNFLWRYDITSDTWDTAPSVPTDPLGRHRRCKRGSDLKYGGGLLYCLKGSNSYECYAFDPAVWDTTPRDTSGEGWRAWTDTLTSVTFLGHRNKKVKSGGSMAYFDSTVYVLKGGNTQEFWTYRSDGDSWVQLTDIPISMRGRRRKVKRGSALAGADSTIYCLKGSYSFEFWEYKPGGDTAGLFSVRPGPTRHGVMGWESTSPNAPTLIACPNPTRAGLSISYSLPVPGHTRIRIYDPAGKLVRTLLSAPVLPGRHTVQWNGNSDAHRRVPAGVYFVKLESGPVTLTRKLVVQR